MTFVRCTVGCGALILAAVASCSSDEQAPTQSDGGTSGSSNSGAQSGGSSGASGQAGRSGSAGAGGSNNGGTDGPGGEGSGGEAGRAAGGEGGAMPSCAACSASSCGEDREACEESPNCAQWLTCADACTDAECLAACGAEHSEVEPFVARIVDCLCASCAEPCTSLEPCDARCQDDISLPLLTAPPPTLAETGLYTSPNARPTEVAPYVTSFRPEYELWSDGAEKQRWAYLPRCGRIDTSNMDHWRFPVGTRFWKEFRVPVGSSGTTLVETRFIHRYGPGVGNWILAAYRWDPNAMSPTAASATYVPNGVVDANGTDHDIPAEGQCTQCHVNGLSERILGFSAFQLSHSLSGHTIRSLSDQGWLSVPARDGFDPPGDATAQAALGYLHANCGNCHNAGTGYGGDTPARTRLSVSESTVEATDAYRTLLGVTTANPNFSTLDRIEPCDPQASSVVVRMARRAPDAGPMPPIGTELVDMTGSSVVSNWIATLPANSSGTCP